MAGYPRMNITQVENAFTIGVTDKDYEYKEYAFNSIDNIIEKLQEVFKQDGKE